jgi:hypothetical protein
MVCRQNSMTTAEQEQDPELGYRQYEKSLFAMD